MSVIERQFKRWSGWSLAILIIIGTGGFTWQGTSPRAPDKPAHFHGRPLSARERDLSISEMEKLQAFRANPLGRPFPTVKTEVGRWFWKSIAQERDHQQKLAQATDEVMQKTAAFDAHPLDTARGRNAQFRSLTKLCADYKKYLDLAKATEAKFEAVVAGLGPDARKRIRKPLTALNEARTQYGSINRMRMRIAKIID